MQLGRLCLSIARYFIFFTAGYFILLSLLSLLLFVQLGTLYLHNWVLHIYTAGYFMYTEAYEEGQAVLSYSRDTTLTAPHCFSFWFFMNGYVGGLALEVERPEVEKALQLWARLGHHNPRWLQAQVQMPAGLHFNKVGVWVVTSAMWVYGWLHQPGGCIWVVTSAWWVHR